MNHVQMLHRNIRSLGYNCDACSVWDDFSKYKVLLVPMLPVVDDALVDKLVRFVHDGGKLLWHPLSGIKDSDCRIYADRLHPKLKEMLKVDIQEYLTFGETEGCSFTWNEATYTAELFADLPTLQDASRTGEYSTGWFAGSAAVWTQGFGQGEITYIGTFAEKRFYHDLFRRLLPDAGVRKCLETEIPPALEVCTRSSEDTELIFIMNHSGMEQKLSLPSPVRDLYHDVDLHGKVSIVPYGVRILQCQ